MGDRLLCLVMPCHSKDSDVQDARFFANKSDIRSEDIDLTGLYDACLKILPGGGKIARANLKPRLRMLTLYYFANALNYLVAGTGNRSEITMGYFTKYGDGGVDILPIGDLLKTDVKKLARHLGVPERIVNKAPTAGLWEGQTDEGEMGITYPELDRIILAMESKNKGGICPEKFAAVSKRMRLSQHKRRGIPVFKVGG